MYAVIKTGGKQYRVVAGEKLKVEKLAADVGATVTLDQILMVSDGATTTIGSPIIAGATVSATVVSHGRGDKVMIFKFRRRKHYRKTQGHRQSYTEIQIGDISASGKAAKPAKAAKAAKAAE
ncbi:MAG TPA: 50S ribosomal protein L21 [Methylotenera sp.]|jgi:large subunit ribosomal protein L21|nr:50S ribosomal protein L21 [Methylotenera sp.]